MSVVQTQIFFFFFFGGGGADSCLQINNDLAGSRNYKMSSVMPFAFNAVELYVVAINEKPWTCVKEICRALEYQKGRVRDVSKKHVSIENQQHKHDLKGRAAEAASFEWPKNSQPNEYYISEDGMYELVFGSQQPKTKEFRKHCCNVMFPHVRQQLTNKMKEEYQQAIKEKDNQIPALEDINEENQQKILRLNEEINDIIANRHIARRGCFDNVLCFIKKNSR